jgi:glycosyltransferase involved in cell wall biosynthesis
MGSKLRSAVVITNYNYAAYVETAVDSALAQTRPLDEIIVVDDGSTDASRSLLEARYGSDARVTLVFGENGGQMAAMKRGVDIADGDIVFFLDADDEWKATYVEKMMSVYDRRPDVDFVFSDMQMFGEATRRIEFAHRELDLGFTAMATLCTQKWYGAPTSALSLRRTMAIRCLELSPELVHERRMCADNALVYGCSILLGRKYYLPTNDVRYRIHGSNGWGIKPSADAKYLNLARSEKLIGHYAHVSGVSRSAWHLLIAEFRTKPVITGDELRRYLKAATRLPAPFNLRMRLAVRILTLGLIRLYRVSKKDRTILAHDV